MPKEPGPQFIPRGKTFVGRGEGRQAPNPKMHVALSCGELKIG